MTARRLAPAHAVSFGSRWRDVLAETFDGRADDHAIAQALSQELDRLPAGEQREVVDCWLEMLLRERRAYGVTLFLLGRLSDPSMLDSLAAYLSPLPPRVAEDEESHLADLIRILAATGEPALMQPVESYLVSRPIGPLWPTVPWALWPHGCDLFVLAWARFFVAVAPARSTSREVLEPFLAEPGAVEAVARRLAGSRSTRWKRVRAAIGALSRESSWLSHDQRSELQRSLS